MERPTSEKVALLERVLNRIRENARDASGRARFLRGAPEPKKGATAHPSVPPPTLAFPAALLPDATPLAAAEAVSPPAPPVAAASPPAPPVAAVASPPPPPVVAAASPPAPPVVAAASPPAPPVAVASPPAPPVAVASPPAPPVAEVASPPAPPVAAVAAEQPAASALDADAQAAAAFDSSDNIPSSAPKRMVTGHDLAELQAGLHGAHQPPTFEPAPGQARSTQALFDQPEELHVDVAFDESQAAQQGREPSAPPPAAEASPSVEALPPPAEPQDITGVHPIAPGVPRPPPPTTFGSPPIEVDLASTIELPAAELASAVHSSSREEPRVEPASSPRLRTSPVIDDDTYPAVSPSSLPPPPEAAARAAPETAPIESHIGMRSPSGVPADFDEGRLPSELPPPPPPLRRSEMPRAPAVSYHEAEASPAAAEPPAPHLVVSPAPPPLPKPAPQPPPAPLSALTLEADAFGRATVQGSAANFVAAVRGAAPRTFGELLDASLALGTDL
ncbi:MAG TPA: hypothetical protein VFS43_45020 [Polyangiaceae bacterium]|nr:hypothetical protein [Polyangiaceae bacterium]